MSIFSKKISRSAERELKQIFGEDVLKKVRDYNEHKKLSSQYKTKALTGAALAPTVALGTAMGLVAGTVGAPVIIAGTAIATGVALYAAASSFLSKQHNDKAFNIKARHNGTIFKQNLQTFRHKMEQRSTARPKFKM